MHEFRHLQWPPPGGLFEGGGGGGGIGGGGIGGTIGVGDGGGHRGPQSAQSVPKLQRNHSLPSPPSSQSPLDAHHGRLAPFLMQLFEQAHCGGGFGSGGDGGGGGGGDHLTPQRKPQSLQSVPIAQPLYSAPGPPSSQ